MRRREKIAILIITSIILTTVFYNNRGKVTASSVTKVGNGKYNITNEKDMFAEYVGVSKNTATVTIPDTIRVKGKTYKVVSIAEGALKGNTKLKRLTIGSKVVLIEKKAFYNCKNLKNITIKAANLTKIGVKSGSFKGINSKAVITVPSQKLSEYKKILKTGGVTGRNQQIKGKKMEEEKVEGITFDKKHPLPDPEEAICSISNIAKAGSDHFDTMKVAETTKYSANDSIPFSARVCMPPALYGQFGTREAYGVWIRCTYCDRKFSSRENYGIHGCMSNECIGANEEYPEYKDSYIESYWISDNVPCKVVFHVTLPEGLSYNEDTVKLVHFENGEIDSSAYKKEVSGQELTVTIDDIKAEPFFSQDIALDSSYIRYPIILLFNAKMNDDITVSNTATASVSYTYKGLEKTIDLGDLTVYASSLQLKNTDATGNVIDGSKFVLYKEKLVYNSANIGIPQYFEVAEAVSADGLLTFTGIGAGKYKLVQTEVPAGFKKMNSLIFSVDMAGKDGSITSLSVKDRAGKKLPWKTDTETGVINATVTNQ